MSANKNPMLLFLFRQINLCVISNQTAERVQYKQFLRMKKFYYGSCEKYLLAKEMEKVDILGISP